MPGLILSTGFITGYIAVGVNHGLCSPNIIATEMRYLRKSKRDRIRNETVRMGLGIIPIRKL
jgi:hypothetical protein